MKNGENMFTLSTDANISAFMEAHDGFELVDHGLAEIETSPESFTRGKSYVEIDMETSRLLDDLVASGICPDIQHALSQAVHSYMIAVLPQTYKLIRA